MQRLDLEPNTAFLIRLKTDVSDAPSRPFIILLCLSRPTPLLLPPVASSPGTPSTDSTNTISATNANTNDQRTTSLTATASSAPTNHPATNPAEHAPPEPFHHRPPASLPRPPRHRSFRNPLGFISTPLIWQGRKRPSGGQRLFSTRAPPRSTVHITKPTVPPTDLLLRSTSRPMNTKQTTGLRYTSVYTPYTPWLKTTPRLDSPTQPPTRRKYSPRPISNKETTTNQDSNLPPASGLYLLSQTPSSRQHSDEALATKESSLSEGAAPLSSSSSSLLSPPPLLSNRKNKPVVQQLSMLGMSAVENQTVSMGNQTDPPDQLSTEDSSGSELFVYNLTELAEEGGSFGQFEPDAAYSSDKPPTTPGANNKQFNRVDCHGALLLVTRPLTAPEEKSEHAYFHHDSESLLGGFISGSELSLTHSANPVNPEAATLNSRPHISTVTVSKNLTGTQSQHRASNSSSSSGQKLEESPYPPATQPSQALTFPPSALVPLVSPLFMLPTPSLAMVRITSSFLAKEILHKRIVSSSVPQKKDITQTSDPSHSFHPLDSEYQTGIAGSKTFSNTFAPSLAYPHYSSSVKLPLTPPSPSPPFRSVLPPFTSSHSCHSVFFSICLYFAHSLFSFLLLL
ncbi:hypothetical protein Q5P01_004570 [Channa striata]|uniref:Uncharacterized protein n=1 Tax=Channa striata TaxID=64152 RepID=A0AA88T0H6_CHASR|nr:hypothetical protein Q5P01_004570 [Channa striata]